MNMLQSAKCKMTSPGTGSSGESRRWSRTAGGKVRPGDFDGLTIMRYAPFYKERSNGGVEQCLRRLNLGLLQKHRLTVLQVHRVNDVRTSRIEVEKVGRGLIVWVPVPYQRTASRFADLPKRARFVYEQTRVLRQQNGESKWLATFNGTRALLRNRLDDLRHRSVILSTPLARFITSHRVNLLAVHGLTYDATSLIMYAKTTRVPFVLINHFDNAAFSEPRVRSWCPTAAGIGAVSGTDLPCYVGDRCVNLSDAVDTEFFAPEKAHPECFPTSSTILLPALIKPGKGQEDLLEAARILAGKIADFRICFAGAVESQSLFDGLRKRVAAFGLENRVVFLGELNQSEIRDCYATSSVVVLPTYSEGLGRCLLEAQAMQKPVIAYDSGGVKETFLRDESGFLLKTGDVEALADRVGFLLQNEAKRFAMGRQGRQFVVCRFSVSALIQRHEDFYLRALGESAGYPLSGGHAATYVPRLDRA